MADLVDRHELRLALEREEAIAKQVLGRGRDALAGAFFDIIYRTLNKMPFAKPEAVLSGDPGGLTEKRLDTIIESEFQLCVDDAPEAINAEQVARHGAERLKRELIRLGFVGTPELREPAE